MHRGDFILQDNKPVWIAHECGSIERNGNHFNRLNIMKTDFAPHPINFKYDNMKSLADVERMMGRSLHNTELMLFEKNRNKKDYDFVKENDRLKCVKIKTD